jgi:geranylgeranyl reductase family protein
MNPRYSCAVVGAGPAGAAAALTLARAGLEVLLLDRSDFPRNKPCAGGLSGAARSELKRLELWTAVEALAYPIPSARIVAPSGQEMILEGGASGHVLDRVRLDALLVEAAVQAGATLHTGVRVTAIEPVASGGHALQTPDGCRARADHVVVATGAADRLAGLERAVPALHAMIGWYEGVGFTPGRLEIRFDPQLAPHYGWLFPESDGRVNVGLCVRPDSHPGLPLSAVFDRFVSRSLADRMAGAREVRPRRGHPILAAHGVPRQPAREGLLVAGEAGQLVNPATGEGISFALTSGRIAAEQIALAVRHGHSPGRVRATYEARLRLSLDWRLRAAAWFLPVAGPALRLLVPLGQRPLTRALVSRLMAHL